MATTLLEPPPARATAAAPTPLAPASSIRAARGAAARTVGRTPSHRRPDAAPHVGPLGPAPRTARRPATLAATALVVPLVLVSLVAFLLAATVAGVAAGCLWTWRTVSPAHPAAPRRSVPAAPELPTAVGDDPPPKIPPAATVPARPTLGLARDRALGYDL